MPKLLEIPYSLRVCGGREWGIFPVFLLSSIWCINMTLGNLLCFHLRPAPWMLFFSFTIPFAEMPHWHGNYKLYLCDGTWKQSSDTMVPQRGETRPDGCCPWNSRGSHGSSVVQDPMKKLLWACLLWRKASEGEWQLFLALSPLKAMACRGVFMLPQKVTILLLCSSRPADAGGAAEVQGKCLWALLPTEFCKSHLARAGQGWESSMGR